MSTPGLVSVLLPCFDAERWVGEAIESILAQSYDRLEVLAIDDGSSDATGEVLAGYAARDARVRHLTNERNLGLIRTLNRALDEARGAFVARMDADDVSVPGRLSTQMRALDARPDVGLVAGRIEMTDERGNGIGDRPVRCFDPVAVRYTSLFATPIAHVTLLARAEVFREHRYRYAPECLHTEDYELWTRMVAAGVRLLNIDERLVRVRVRSGSVSRAFEETQIENFVEVARRHLEAMLDVHPGEGEHRALVNRLNREVTGAELLGGLRWLDRIRDRFVERHRVDGPALDEIRAVTEQQRVDVLGQAILKGPSGRRAVGVALALSAPWRLLGKPGRTHLARKLARRGGEYPGG